jgi:hypothetical protein
MKQISVIVKFLTFLAIPVQMYQHLPQIHFSK